MSIFTQGATLSDSLYTNSALLLLLAQYQEQKAGVQVEEENFFDMMLGKMLPQNFDDDRPTSNLTMQDLVKRPVLLVVLAYLDAFKNNHHLTLDNNDNEVPKAPELIRVLVTESLSTNDAKKIEDRIKKSLTDALDTRGLAQVPIFICENADMVRPNQRPAVHIGIDYEEIDIIKEAATGQGSQNIRTSRGEDVATHRNRDDMRSVR